MQQWQIEQLKKQLSELAPVCFACGLSEEETMCDILVDSKCYQGICAICLKKKESENCTKCTLKMGEHHKKSRGYSKDPLLD